MTEFVILVNANMTKQPLSSKWNLLRAQLISTIIIPSSNYQAIDE